MNPFMRTSLIFILPITLVACISAPPYEGPPDVDLGQEWTLSDRPVLHPDEPSTLGSWWESFDDSTLTRLITEGVQQNHDIRRAVLRINEARAQLAGARSGFWPSADLEGSVTRRRQSENGSFPVGLIPGVSRDQTLYDLGLNAGWEIDLFGRIRHSVEAADARFQATEEDARAVRISISAEIARTYFALRGAQKQLVAQQSSIKSLQDTLTLVRRRVDAGDLPPVEISVTEARLTAAQALLPTTEANIRASALALGTLLGGLPEKELPLIESPAETISLPDIPVGQRADLLRQRPDIRTAERRLAASAADLQYAVAEQFPKLTISAAGGFEALSSGDLLRSRSETWSILPFISWRIFDGGRVRADIHAAEARQQDAALAYEQTVLAALGEAEQAMSSYLHMRESLIRQQQAVQQAHNVLQSQQRRFEAGDIAMLDVLQAQQQLYDAEQSLAGLESNAAMAGVDVFKALGGEPEAR